MPGYLGQHGLGCGQVAQRGREAWLVFKLPPRGLWWRGAMRWSLATLWRGYRQALGQQAAFHPARAGTRGTWAEKEAWLHHLDALVAAALPM